MPLIRSLRFGSGMLLLRLTAGESHCEHPVNGPCADERTFAEGAEFNICCNCVPDGALCTENSANDGPACATSASQFDPMTEKSPVAKFEIAQQDIDVMAELCAASDTGT